MRVDSKVATEVQALLPLLVVFAVFYAFLIRPQHREMLGRLKKGDRVLTRGGLYGVVMEVKDNDLMLELAQNVRVRADRSAVQALVKRGSAGG